MFLLLITIICNKPINCLSGCTEDIYIHFIYNFMFQYNKVSFSLLSYRDMLLLLIVSTVTRVTRCYVMWAISFTSCRILNSFTLIADSRRLNSGFDLHELTINPFLFFFFLERKWLKRRNTTDGRNRTDEKFLKRNLFFCH